MDPEGGADYGSGAGAYGEQAQQDAAGMAAYDPAAAASWGAEAGAGGAYDASTYEAGAGAYAAGGYEGGSYEAAAYEAAEGYGTYGVYDSAAAAAGPGSSEGGWGAEAATAAAGEAAATGEYAAAAASYSPAEYLRYLEGEIQRLSSSKAGLQQQMAAAATAAYREMSGRLGEAGTGVPVPADIPSLVEELAALQAVQQYLQYLQELEALTRHVEKAVGALQQAQQGGADGGAFLQSASEAVEAFSATMSYVGVVRQLSAGEQVPSAKLRRHAQRLLDRVEAAQAALRALLSEELQRLLGLCNWPPPLSLGSGAGGTPAAAAASSVFEAPGAAAGVEAVQRLLVVLLTLQRAVQHEQFQALAEAAGEPPLLWPAEELARGIATRLRHHFAEGLPTDRADKPEWLFAATLKAVQQQAPAVAVFQPCIEAHGLQSWYSMLLEFARAVQSMGLNAILREHLLPTLCAAGLAEGGDALALWLHYADEAMAFEKRFAPLRGHFVTLADEEELAAAAHPNSSIELLFEEAAWRDGWLGAEGWDALRQMDSACDAFNAWQPAQLALETDFLADTPRARDHVASRQEFWPPACAEQVTALVTGLVRRCGWVAGADNRRAFMQAVPLHVLRSFRERLGRQLQVAEGYRAMLGEQWLPSVGAAICAAHYVEHQLREPQGVLLLVELQDADPTAAAAGRSSGMEVDNAATAATPAARGSGVAALVEREAAAYGTLRRQWAYKLAKQAVDRFHELFAPYKHDLSTFTVGYDSEAPDAGYRSGPGMAGQPEEEAGAVGVSPLMLIAADKLLQMLGALSQHLDSVVFRDVWKAVALAVNYAAFNDIATEALFSTQGSRQFDADVSALAAVFGEYTSRPAAHFKETKEACRLLLLPRDQAAAVLSALQQQPGAAKEVLRPMGVKLLSVDQAATVLMQRLDLLTSGH